MWFGIVMVLALAASMGVASAAVSCSVSGNSVTCTGGASLGWAGESLGASTIATGAAVISLAGWMGGVTALIAGARLFFAKNAHVKAPAKARSRLKARTVRRVFMVWEKEVKTAPKRAVAV